MMVFLYHQDNFASFQKQIQTKTCSTKEKEEREDIINQICWGSGNWFYNWNGSSSKSNKCGLYPKHMAGNDNYPI